MGLLKKVNSVLVFASLFFALLACGGGADRPFTLDNTEPEIPIFNPDDSSATGSDGTLEEEGGCEIKLTEATIDLKVSANQGNDPVLVLDAEPVSMDDLTFVVNGTSIRLLGSKFPAVRLAELADDNDIIIRGDSAGNIGIGTIDSDGNIEIKGFKFTVDVTSGKELDSSILQTITVFPKVTFVTSSVTATGNHDPITVVGSPLNSETREVTLVAQMTVPSGTILDGGGIGGGALTATFQGKFDKLPNDPTCSGGSAELGPAKIQVQRLTYNIDDEEILEDLAANSFDFGEKFAGSNEEKKLVLRIKSLGEQSLVINQIQTNMAGPFIALNKDGTNINSLSIAAGEFADIEVLFNPKADHITTDKTPFNIALNIKNNDPEKSNLAIQLKALGLAPASRMSVRILKKNESGNEYSFSEVSDEEFFGTVTYATPSGLPKKLYRLFRIYNTGVINLPFNHLSSLNGEFNLGALRYGVNTFKACENNESPNHPEDDCSIAIDPSLFTQENSSENFYNIEPADLNDLAKSPHFDVLVTYQPIDFSVTDQKTLEFSSQDGQSQQILLKADVDDNSRAKPVLWIDETPENSEDFASDILIPNHTRYNYKRVLSADETEFTVHVYVQNAGVVGGEKLKLDPNQIVIEGDALDVSFLTDQADSSLQSGVVASANPAEGDGKVFLGTLKLVLPEDRKAISKVSLRIPASSIKENGQASLLEDEYVINIYYGLPEGEITFKLTKAYASIQNSLVKDPTATNDDVPPGSIPMNVKLSGESGMVIHYLSSTQPNFTTFPDEGSVAPACTGSPAEKKQCAENLSPVRLDTTSLGTPEGTPCHEGNYDGSHQPGECSYFGVSFAGKEGSSFRTGVLKDTLPNDSSVGLDEEKLTVEVDVNHVIVRLINSEHNKMNSSSGYFDQVFDLNFTTGVVDSQKAGFGANSYPPLEDDLASRSVNKGEFASFICDGEDDGDANFASCELPADIPSGHGMMLGRPWDLNTNEMTIVGATRWDNSTAMHFPADDFYSLLGPSNFYVVLRGVMCGDSIGVSCDDI